MNMAEFEICSYIARSGKFDEEYYLENNPDVVASGIDPILHYVRYGEAENRKPSEFFDPAHAVKVYPSVANLFLAWLKCPDIYKRIPEKPVIPIVFCLDEGYLPWFGVSLASIIAHSSPNFTYIIYIINDNIDSDRLDRFKIYNEENVEIIFVSSKEYSNIYKVADGVQKIITINKQYILVPKVVRNHKKAIYLDSDVLVLDDISRLYNQNIDDACLGAVKQQSLYNDKSKQYNALDKKSEITIFNSGVLLFNIPMCTKYGFTEEIYSDINNNYDHHIEDKYKNIKMLPIDEKWNFQWDSMVSGNYSLMTPREFQDMAINFSTSHIIHFSGKRKPWNFDDGHFTRLYWEYAQKSPLYEEIEETLGQVQQLVRNDPAG